MLSPRDNSGRSFAAMNMSHGNGTLPRLHYLEMFSGDTIMASRGVNKVILVGNLGQERAD